MISDLKVSLSSKGSILNVADLILCKIEVSKVCEAVHGSKEDSLKFVLIQPQVVNLGGKTKQMTLSNTINHLSAMEKNLCSLPKIAAKSIFHLQT